MFKKLRDKLKNAVDGIKDKVSQKDVVEEEPEEAAEEKEAEPEEKPAAEEPEERETPQEETTAPEKRETPRKEPAPTKEETPTKAAEEPEERETSKQEAASEDKGFFTKLSEKFTTVQLSDEEFDELFWDLELALLENNVAVSVIEKIKEDLKEELTSGRTARGGLDERILRRLEESLREVLSAKPIDLIASTKQHQPLIIAAVGVNGSGKTTTLAKLAKKFQDADKSVVLAACDTFRAAAIQQLEAHAKKLDVPIITQEYGADPAAVAYDAIQHAQSKGLDVVLIDTAGRLHSNKNLMDELEKLVRVAKPHHTLFVGEAVTGNDCVQQASKFDDALGIDGIILTKADVDEKGGAAVSVSHVTNKPILYLGTGQDYDDLEAFSPDDIIKNVLPAIPS